MDEQTDIRFMKIALEEAKKAFDKGEVPIGAVVAAKGKVIARGHNLTETLADATAHAEMQVITSAASALGGKYLKGCTLYVTVEPCPMCASACYWCQVERIVYGAPDSKRGYSVAGANLLHPKTEVTAGVMAEGCGELMKDFFKKLRG